MMLDPAQYKRGWCPGIRQPMMSGDGLLVRIRPRAGAFPLTALLAVCDAAACCGNGEIDLTRRANLQVRGVSTETLPALIEQLAPYGLLDASAEAEAVRNVMVSPLAGACADEILDMRPLARALEQALATDAELWRLPAKFGFVLDGGGGPTLEDVRGDIRLLAQAAGGAVTIALGVERMVRNQSAGPFWLVGTSPAEAPTAAIRIAKACLAGASVEDLAGTCSAPSPLRGESWGEGACCEAAVNDASTGQIHRSPQHVSPLTPALSQAGRGNSADRRNSSGGNSALPGDAKLATQITFCDSPHGGGENRASITSGQRRRLGAAPLADGRVAVGIAVAFGRISARDLAKLSHVAVQAGCEDVRLSPWRALYIVAPDEQRAARILDRASALDLIVDDTDPLLAIDACPGKPACDSATLATRETARALTRLLPQLSGIGSIHVSGCAKGCARSKPADLVLAARGDRLAVIRHGRADDASDLSIAPADIARLPELLRDATEGTSHV